MKDYMVLTVLDENDENVSIVLKTLLDILKTDKGNIIFIGSLERARRIALKDGMALPFSALVSSYEEVLEEMAAGERVIFYAVDQDKFARAMHIAENTPAISFLSLGSHEREYCHLKEEASPNVLECLILASDGNRIFPYPEGLECTKETIMDMLINVASLTSNSFFRQDKPFIIVRENRSDIEYEWITECSRKLSLPLMIVNEGSLIDRNEARAVLSFSDLGHSDDMKIYFGLPFFYFNAVRNPGEALLAALRITKIISRGAN